ncbi:MAG: IgGFc-binding protein [Labilithrix sp.]|nr:IgGFc-binding protein [Labilithrix sp.]
MSSSKTASRGFLCALGIAFGVSAMGACSGADRRFATNDEQFEADAGPLTDEPERCGRHCSRDLKQVLDGCEGAEEVVQQCSADQGCGGEACVDACLAAQAQRGSAGCEFLTLPPEDATGVNGSCFAALIANTWDRAVALTAEYDGAPLDISGSTYIVDRKGAATSESYTPLEGPLPAGQVAVVLLSDQSPVHDPIGGQIVHCPPSTKAALDFDPIRHGTVLTKSFRIAADAPVAAYASYPYGGEIGKYPTATLLFPVSAWEKEYIAVSPFDFPFDFWAQVPNHRWLQIVAAEDATDVTITPNADIGATPETAPAYAGQAQTYRLARGQVLQIMQPRVNLTGSPISASKPVGLFGGSSATFLAATAADVLGQQIPAVAQWGSRYAVVPFRSRIQTFDSDFRENVPYTIVGAVDGTVLEYAPSRPNGAPETISAGESVHFFTDQVFVVKSQDKEHPIYAAVYMTGSGYGNGTGQLTTGDPDFVNVPPADQFLDRYVFFTDYTYPDTSLTVVRKKVKGGFKPVTLECVGDVTSFLPLDGEDGEFEYAWVKLTEGYVERTVDGKRCGYGRQEASSEGPFAITVWGTGLASSYGYVAGTGLRPINSYAPIK